MLDINYLLQLHALNLVTEGKGLVGWERGRKNVSREHDSRESVARSKVLALAGESGGKISIKRYLASSFSPWLAVESG